MSEIQRLYFKVDYKLSRWSTEKFVKFYVEHNESKGIGLSEKKIVQNFPTRGVFFNYSVTTDALFRLHESY